MKKSAAGFMFIELLFGLLITLFLVFTLSKLYLKPAAVSLNPQENKFIAESGVDATTYKTVVDSTKNKVEEIQNKHFEDLNKLGE